MTKQQIVEAVKIWHSTHPTNELESWKIQNLMGNILGWNTPEQVEVSKMMTKKQVTTNQTANVNSPGDNATANVNEDVPDIGEVSNPLHHSYREAMARSGGTLAEWLVEQEDIEEEHHCGAWTHNCITKEKLNAFLEKFFITKYEAQLAIAQAKAAGAKEEREKILREGLFVGDYDLELLGYRLKLLSNELFLDYFYEEWSKENDGIFGSKNPEEAKEWLQNGIKRNFFRHDSVGIQKKGAKLMQIAMERLASFAAEPLSPKEERKA